MNLPINEEEVLNQALMAYTLGYPWVIHQDVLKELSTDFFKTMYEALRESKIIVSTLIDNKGLFSRFTREVRTSVVCSNGFVAEHQHAGLVAGYVQLIDRYRRGFRP